MAPASDDKATALGEDDSKGGSGSLSVCMRPLKRNTRALVDVSVFRRISKLSESNGGISKRLQIFAS